LDKKRLQFLYMSALNEYMLQGDAEDGGPAGHKQMHLTDILTPEQLHHLEALLQANPDPEDALQAMKEYFGTISAELEAKGVVAGYLAYLLYAKLIGAI